MTALRRFVLRLVASITRRSDEDRMREEFETHLAFATDDNLRAGLSLPDARRKALLTFGSPEAMKEQWRDQQRFPAFDEVLQDARYTVRHLRKSPVFTLTAVLSLALGIGANTAVFTVVEHLFIRSLPVPDPHELVFVTDQRTQEDDSPRFSYPFYTALRANPVLDGTAARFSVTMNLAKDGEVARVRGELVSGNYFSVLRAPVQVGRALTPQEDRNPGAHPVVVISDGFWRRSFGADRRVLGRNIRLNDYTFTIVGVAGRGFTGTDVGSPTDVWLPLAMQREIGRDLLTDARTNWLEMFGRLGSGKSLDRAGDELSAYLEAAPSARLTHSPHRRLVLLPGAKGNSMMRRELGPALQVFMALSALAMLLACINVANLLTLRSAARDKEIAVRLALGAGRPRLTRQFMTETLVLAALAGSAGLLSAPWAGRLLIASQPLAREIETGLNARVLMFAFALSVLSAVAVALAPVLGSRRIGLSELLGNSSGAPRTAGRTARVHDVVVTLQIAMSVAMLITAALLTQSLRGLKSVNPGFRADDLLLITMDPGAAGYDGDRLERFWRAAVDRVSQIDEVQSVSLARTVPLTPDRQRQPWLSPASGELHEIDTNFIGPRYFRTLGVPILRGREFDARDVKASRPVVIVNERLARMFWPGQDAVGKGLRLAGLGGTGQSSPVEPPSDAVPEVIGVVRDVKYRDLRGDYAPLVYRPLFQTNSSDPMTLHVRARGDAGMVALRIRSEMRFVDAQVPLFGITTLEGLMDSSFAQTRQAAGLTAAFGILALVLSGMGVYGVTALATTRRTRELAIRIALGASRRHMTALIAHRGIIVTGVGLTIGLLAALGFGQISRALLYGITATESAASFAGTAALVSLVATAAFYFPFRAATRLDIATAIRYE